MGVLASCYQQLTSTNHNTNFHGVYAMTIHDYISYLGKNVFFAVKSNLNPQIDNLFYFVEGKVDGILLSENLEKSGFRLDEEIYLFDDVIFLSRME